MTKLVHMPNLHDSLAIKLSGDHKLVATPFHILGVTFIGTMPVHYLI